MKSFALLVCVVLVGLATWQPFEAKSQGLQVAPVFDQALVDQVELHESELASLRSDVALIRQQVAAVESSSQCQCGPDCPCLAPQSTPAETLVPVSFGDGETYCDPETGVCYQVSSDGSMTAGTCSTGTCGTSASADGGIFVDRDGEPRRPVGRILSGLGERLSNRPGIVGRIRARRGW